MKSFKWIWQYLKHYKLRLLLGFSLVLVTSCLNMVNPYIMGKIVDDVILGGNKNLLVRLIILLTAATLAKTVVRYSFVMSFESMSQKIFLTIRENIYAKLQELDFNYFDKTRTGDIMARMTGDMDAVRHFVAWVMYMVFENATTFLFAVIMLFVVNFRFALILMTVAPILGFLTVRLASDVKPAFFAIREQFSRLNTVVQENVSGNRVVKAYAKEGYEISKFTRQNDEFRKKNLEASAIWQKYLPVLDSLASVQTVIMILVGGIMVMRGYLSMGQLIVFNGYIWCLTGPMRISGWLVNDVQRFAASGEKVAAILETEPEIKNSENKIKAGNIQGRVDFQNVSFNYGDDNVLNDISFSARPGQTIAVIGPTGSGKSTLVSLICRFYDCSEGEIYIDGINIKDIDIKELRSGIAVAMQDIFLFSDTIEGNIAYGDPDASMEQIQWAAGVASAHQFITSFPEGYDTIIGERGVGLSGGQRQRIALARALLKNPSILILDDTTSSVDVETEYEIQKKLKSFYKNKTTFIIAHRISSVKSADQILVLGEGRIIEKGKHEELLTKKRLLLQRIYESIW